MTSPIIGKIKLRRSTYIHTSSNSVGCPWHALKNGFIEASQTATWLCPRTPGLRYHTWRRQPGYLWVYSDYPDISHNQPSKMGNGWEETPRPSGITVFALGILPEHTPSPGRVFALEAHPKHGPSLLLLVLVYVLCVVCCCCLCCVVFVCVCACVGDICVVLIPLLLLILILLRILILILLLM